MRNASRLIPITFRNAAPPSANNRSIAAATLTALKAMRRLSCAAAPVVSPVNNGMSEMGSTTTKNTTKNFSGCSNSGDMRFFLKAREVRRNINCSART